LISGLPAIQTGATTVDRSAHVPQPPSEGETSTDCGSEVVVGVIGDAGFMRNGDGQAAAHPGIRNSGKPIETLGEMTIDIERPSLRVPAQKLWEPAVGSRSEEHGSRFAAVDTRRK
jgi:hypothetical protein